MHDPYSTIKDFSICGKHIATLWHVDPCTDGTDDSCGMFKRARHGKKDVLNKIQGEFEFNLKHNYWFDEDGHRKFSTIGLMFEMYRKVLWIYFDRDRKKIDKFMRRHTHDIIYIAENPHDCLGDTITNRWGADVEELANDRIALAGNIYAHVLRMDAKWWQDPKWHVHHWKISFSLFRRMKNKTSCNVDENLRATV